MCKSQQHNDSIIGIWLKFRFEFETCQRWLVINVFSTRSSGCHRRQFFDLTSFNYQEKLPYTCRWSNKVEKNILTASQFAGCLALNKTPAVWVTMLCSWIRQSQCPFTVQNEVDTVVKDELLGQLDSIRFVQKLTQEQTALLSEKVANFATISSRITNRQIAWPAIIAIVPLKTHNSNFQNQSHSP